MTLSRGRGGGSPPGANEPRQGPAPRLTGPPAPARTFPRKREERGPGRSCRGSRDSSGGVPFVFLTFPSLKIFSFFSFLHPFGSLFLPLRAAEAPGRVASVGLYAHPGQGGFGIVAEAPVCRPGCQGTDGELRWGGRESVGKGGLKGDPTAWHPSAPGLNGKARGQSPESRSPAGAAALGGGTWTTTATVWAELGHQTPRPLHPPISSLPPTGRSQLKPECKVFRDGQLLGAQSEA